MISNDEFGSLAQQVLQSGGSLRFTARGTSMHPFLQDGDVVELVRVGNRPLAWGEVALVRAPDGELLLHRVYRTRLMDGVRQLLVRGDNRSTSDGWINPADVLGRAHRAWRSGRRLALVSAQVWIWMALAVLRNRFRKFLDEYTLIEFMQG